MSNLEAADSQSDEDSAENDEVKFITELRKFYSLHDQNTKKSEWTEEKIKNIIKMIEDFNKAKVLRCRPTNKEYYYSKKYDIINIGAEKVLVVKTKSKKEPVVQIVPSSQYYKRILDIHVATGHGRRDKIIYELKNKYVIPVFAINIFLRFCKTCFFKRSFPKTGTHSNYYRCDSPEGEVDVDVDDSENVEVKFSASSNFCSTEPGIEQSSYCSRAETSSITCSLNIPNKRSRSEDSLLDVVGDEIDENPSREDEFDIIGKNIACKLRRFSPNTRIFAEKLLNDIMYNAELGQLSKNSIILVSTAHLTSNGSNSQ